MNDKLKMADMGGWSAEYDGLGSSAAHAIANSEGEVVAIAVTRGGGFHPPEVTPIAQRIVACCNACTGIPTEQLESDFAQGYEPWGEVQHLRKQRDELLEALEAEQEWREREAAGAIDDEWDYEAMVGAKRKAAIAKALGTA